MRPPLTRALPDARKLSSARFFTGLGERQIAEVVAAGTRVEKRKGAWFYRQGDAATHFYLLEAGWASIHHLAPDANDVLLRIMVPFEIFGFRSIDPDGVHVTSIQAGEDSRCLAWRGPVMRDLLFAHPQLAINAFQIASAHMFQFEIRYKDLATVPLEKRVARMLLGLAAQMGRQEGDVIVLERGILQKDISQMTGSSVYSVSRIFAAWNRGGILRRHRGQIVLRDISSLRRIAAGAIMSAAAVGLVDSAYGVF